MDLLLALELAHWVAILVWAAAAAVMALILLAARRDAAAAARARPEAALVAARALRPATLALLLTGLPLAASVPRPALRLAGLELAAQAAPFALMVVQPGWSETAILAGLVACVALAAALLREATDVPFRPAA